MHRCFVSHIQRRLLVANPKKLLYTVASPARGLLNRGKRKKKTSGSSYLPMGGRPNGALLEKTEI